MSCPLQSPMGCLLPEGWAVNRVGDALCFSDGSVSMCGRAHPLGDGAMRRVSQPSEVCPGGQVLAIDGAGSFDGFKCVDHPELKDTCAIYSADLQSCAVGRSDGDGRAASEAMRADGTPSEVKGSAAAAEGSPSASPREPFITEWDVVVDGTTGHVSMCTGHQDVSGGWLCYGLRGEPVEVCAAEPGSVPVLRDGDVLCQPLVGAEPSGRAGAIPGAAQILGALAGSVKSDVFGMPVLNSCDVLKSFPKEQLVAHMVGAARQAIGDKDIRSSALNAIRAQTSGMNIDMDLPISPFSGRLVVDGLADDTGSKLLNAFGLPTSSSAAFNDALFGKIAQAAMGAELAIQGGKARMSPALRLDSGFVDVLTKGRSNVTVRSPQKCLPSACTPKACTPRACTPRACTPRYCPPKVWFVQPPCTPEVCSPEVCTPEICSPEICTPEICTPGVSVNADVRGMRTRGSLSITPTVEHTCQDLPVGLMLAMAAGGMDISDVLKEVITEVTPRIENASVSLALDREGSKVLQPRLDLYRAVNIDTGKLDRAINNLVLPRVEQQVSSGLRGALVQ
jgi:hypothetical protein